MNYLIEYKAIGEFGVKTGTIRAKNKSSEFEAKAGLENHFIKTLRGFERLVVIKCSPENSFDVNDFFDLFKK